MKNDAPKLSFGHDHRIIAANYTLMNAQLGNSDTIFWILGNKFILCEYTGEGDDNRITADVECRCTQGPRPPTGVGEDGIAGWPETGGSLCPGGTAVPFEAP